MEVCTVSLKYKVTAVQGLLILSLRRRFIMKSNSSGQECSPCESEAE